MATSSIVNTLGAGSGIDVKALAQSLVDAEMVLKKERDKDIVRATGLDKLMKEDETVQIKTHETYREFDR